MHNPELINQGSKCQKYNSYPPYLINDNISPLSIEYTVDINNPN